MLNEKLLNTGKSFVYCELLKIDEYPFHMHEEVEIIYLLKGELDIKVSLYNVKLTPGNLFVVNHDTLHYIHSLKGDNVALLMHIDISQFKEYYPNIDKCIFICNSEKPEDSHPLFEKLKALIMDLARLYYSNLGSRDADIHSLCLSLLLMLVNHFQYWHIGKADIVSSNIYKDKIFQIQRLRRIVDYIYSNYHKKITLANIAELEHVSKYYVSHLISNGLGTSFQDFLNGVRVEKSIEYLFGARMNLDEIAEKCGFSSVNFFRKSVIEKTGDNPSALRRKYHEKTISTMVPQLCKYSGTEAEEALSNMSFAHDNNNGKREVLHFLIDLNALPTKNRFEFSPRVHLGSLGDIWRSGLKKHLTYLKDYQQISIVSIDFKLLENYYNKTKNWDYMNSFFREILDTGFEIEIAHRGKTPALDSFFAYSKTNHGVMPRTYSHNDIHIENESASIINYVLKSGKDVVHIGLSSLLSEDGLKLPAFYAADFLIRLKGDVIKWGSDCLFSFSDSEYKVMILNNFPSNKSLVKDFILNVMNISSSTVVRVFRLNTETGNEAGLWNSKHAYRELTPDLKWSIENVCAPKTELFFLESSPEQDILIALEQDEAVLVVMSV